MRPRDAVILLCVAAAAMMLPNGMDSAARACSVFALTADGDVVVGRNLDWHDPMPGAVLVNVRGTEKSVLPWQGNWPASQDSPPVVWSSRFGSVTFTCYGRDFIESGMNEAGLIVAEASFEAVYAPDDGRPGVSCAQWMQFQLDNYATVAELLEHVGELRLDGEGWHYLVADASGACAVIEHQKGQPLVYSLDEVPVSALTNTSYAQALTHVPLDVAFGGEFDIGEGNDSYGRFVRMATLLRDYSAEADVSPAQYAFHVLDEVSGDETRRSVVYDAAARRVHWTTESSTGVLWLDMACLDFSAGAHVMMSDIDPGNVGGFMMTLVEYTKERNRVMVSAVLDVMSGTDDLGEVLAARGLTYASVCELIAAHPTAPVAAGDGVD